MILTGAGISAESGIRTFRDSNGLWNNHAIEEVASPAGFARNPELVLDFYNQRRRQLLSDEVKENAAHVAIARLQRDHPGDVLLVTQNVDELHERAGSTDVIHMHGELLKMRCVKCGAVTEIKADLMRTDPCSECSGVGFLRPHIVWFGEMPFEMDRIELALRCCDLFVSIGTSGAVYPAAGFVSVANSVGADTICLNLEETNNGTVFQRGRYGPATEIVPRFVDELLSR